MRDTSEPAGSSGRGREFAAVSRGRIIDWDAYEAILDDILYSKVSTFPQDRYHQKLFSAQQDISESFSSHLHLDQFSQACLRI